MAGKVFVTATSFTPSRARPTRAQAAAIFASTVATFRRMASRSSITDELHPTRGADVSSAQQIARVARRADETSAPLEWTSWAAPLQRSSVRTVDRLVRQPVGFLVPHAQRVTDGEAPEAAREGLRFLVQRHEVRMLHAILAEHLLHEQQ